MVQNKGEEDHLRLLGNSLAWPHSSVQLQGDLGAVGAPLSGQGFVTRPSLQHAMYNYKQPPCHDSGAAADRDAVTNNSKNELDRSMMLWAQSTT